MTHSRKNTTNPIVFYLMLFAISMILLLSQTTVRAEHQLNEELIINGDFSKDTADFKTDYKYSKDYIWPHKKWPEGVFGIETNAQKVSIDMESCGDHTNGTGKYMIINGFREEDKTIWSQTVTGLTHDAKYEISFWASPLVTFSPAFIYVYINGNMVIWATLDTVVCHWQHFTVRWYNEKADNAVIRLVDGNTRQEGNDFGIDDISFQLKCNIKAEAGQDYVTCADIPVQFEASPIKGMPPYSYKWSPSEGLDRDDIPNPTATVKTTTAYVVTITDGNDCSSTDWTAVYIVDPPSAKITTDKSTTVCEKDSILLSAPGGYTYSWSTGETTQSILVKQSGKYDVLVKSGYNCSNRDTVQITYVPLPTASIITDKPNSKVCPCDSVLLTAPANLKYFWSTGENTQSIYAKDSGKYTLTVENANGCRVSVDTLIQMYNLSTRVSLGSDSIKVGEIATIPIKARLSDEQKICGYTNYKTTVRFNKTMLLPVEDTPFGRVEDNEQVIDLEGAATDTIIANLKLRAALGNSECTDITFDNFSWGCGNVQVESVKGKLCTKGICKEPTARLFDETQQRLLKVPNPNPAQDFADINFTTIEEANTELYIINTLGAREATIGQNFFIPGTYSVRINTDALPTGSYYVVLKTYTKTFVQRLEVVH